MQIAHNKFSEYAKKDMLRFFQNSTTWVEV